MNIGIYKLISNCNKCYVGSSINLEKRRKEHFRHLKNNYHGNSRLQNFYNKHGISSLTFEVIEYVEDVNKLIEREQFYIDTLKPFFNICEKAGNTIGQSGGMKGKKLSRERKELMSKKMKGRVFSEETIKKMKVSAKKRVEKYGHPMTGFKHTDETKQKISNGHKGKKLTDEQKEKFTYKGRKHTDEFKINLSKRQTGFKHTDETKKIISEKATGRKGYWGGKTLPDEIKLKISETLKNKKCQTL